MIKRSSKQGLFEVALDGVYENPTTGDRFQFRSGHQVPPAVKDFRRVGPWPGEPTEEDQEAAATAAKAEPTAPENKKEPEPENKGADKPADKPAGN